MPKQGTNDAATFAARHFRKSDLEVAHAHAAKPAVQQVNQQSQGHGCCPCRRPGQCPERAHNRPHQGIFQPMAHGLHVIGLAKYQCGSIAGLGFSGGSLWFCGACGEAGCCGALSVADGVAVAGLVSVAEGAGFAGTGAALGAAGETGVALLVLAPALGAALYLATVDKNAWASDGAGISPRKILLNAILRP